jgi:hypothetical protein
VADITKDSFVEANRHTKILFQRGRDVIDFELNEMQDISRTLVYRALEAQAEGLNPGSNDDGYKIVGIGASDQVLVKAGTLFVDGVPILLSEDQTLFVPTNNGSQLVILSVYLAVNEVEIVDPAMIPELGETTRRRKLIVNIHTIEGETLPADSINEIWRGGTRNYKIAEIIRPIGQSVVDASQVRDLRFLMPAFYVGRLVEQTAIFPPPLEASQLLLEPEGWGDCLVAQFSSTVTGVQIRGFSPNVRLKRKTFVNSGDYPIELVRDDGVIGEHRMLNTVSVQPKGAVDLIFSDEADGWYAVYPGDEAELPDEIVASMPNIAAGANILDYNPAGWLGATIVLLMADSGSNVIRGLEHTGARRRKTLVNIGSWPIRFLNDGASGFGNRTYLAQTDFWLHPGEAVNIVHLQGGPAFGWYFGTTPTQVKSLIHSGSNTYSGQNTFNGNTTFGGLTTLGTVAVNSEQRVTSGASFPYKTAAGVQEYRDRIVTVPISRYGNAYIDSGAPAPDSVWQSEGPLGLATHKDGNVLWIDLNDIITQGCRVMNACILYRQATSSVVTLSYGFQQHDFNLLGTEPPEVFYGSHVWNDVAQQSFNVIGGDPGDDLPPEWDGKTLRVLDGSGHVVDKQFNEYKLRIVAGNAGTTPEYLHYVLLFIREYAMGTK